MVLRNFFKKIGTGLKGKSHCTLDNATSEQQHPPYKVKIVRSQNRRRTISARLVEDVMLVRSPAGISDAELNEVIDKLKKRLQKKKLKQELDRTQGLRTTAQRLNREYFNGRLKIKSIEYSTSQNRGFGCCNYKAGKILISHRLAQMLPWVRDYVVLHEMAHLVEPNHSRSFWDIVSRYKLTERARGYLMAKGLDSEGQSSDIEQRALQKE